MMTITSATTKSELVEMLKKVQSKVRKVSTELADEVKYATGMFAKDASKVTKKDLLSLIADVEKALAVPASADSKKPAKADAPKEKPKATLKKKEEPKVENLIKPAKKGAPKKSEEPKKEEAKKPAPKKPEGKKSPVNKKAEKESAQKVVDDIDYGFPDTLTLQTEDGEVEYNLASGEFKNFKELEKYLSDEDNPAVVIAVPITKKQAKQLDYGWGIVPLPKDGFPNDIDVYVPIYVGVSNNVIHLASLYTDCPLQIVAGAHTDDVEELDGVRFLAGIAYQIYVEA